ncbi:LOW QUALITY PROTEIN: centrosomal protein of 72 kDa [Diretmus argenteus]
MAAVMTTITEQWIRERLRLEHPCLGDVRSLSLPGTSQEKIRHLGTALRNFVRLKSLDLSYNALVSVEGVQHLTRLERLNLYYNCIPSIDEVKVLYELPALRELDLRLNPLTKTHPDYRLHLVHAMSNLRKLDSCPVRDTERKVAIMQFSSAVGPQQKIPTLTQPTEQRRKKKTDIQPLVINGDEVEIASNFCFLGVHLDDNLTWSTNTSAIIKKAHQRLYFLRVLRKNNFSKELMVSFYRCSIENHPQSKVTQMKAPCQKNSSTSLKVTEKPRVSFGPYVEKHRPVPGRQKQDDPHKHTRLPAKGHFTPNPDQDHRHSSVLVNIRPPSPRSPGLNLSDPSNPILHPPRLSYWSFNKTAGISSLPQKKRGSYRKPLEMLLNLVDKHWTGERSLHHNNNFLSQAVQILSMMESDISSREAEVRTLTGEVDALTHQVALREEEHKTEVHDLSTQLEEAQNAVRKLNEQLRIVLEENVALQKQLIKLEQQYLKSMMKNSPMTQIKKAQTEVGELRKEIEVLREKVQEAEKVKELAGMLQESHRSLVATNQRLLGELKGSEEHW